ncbi:MAG: ABC transporter ATP-binding protein [Anaerolineae bacterium]|nr:ABC transporter ATP-binding protein [Anaerolineae bacterium]
MPASLSAEHISHTFRTPAGTVPALRDVTFTVEAGRLACVVGPSGCGKSTLLRVLAGLLKPDAGRVLLNGAPVEGPNHQIGIVFQKANLMPWRTVMQNLTLPLELDGVPAEKRRARAEALIDLVGLGGFTDAYPGELSGGMAQRVAMARALIYAPEVLLLDEPFGALDAMTRERLGVELLRIWEAERRTVVMVTHSIAEALFLGDHVMVMGQRPGHIVRWLDVPLPRPRSLDVIHSPAFGQLSAQVRAAIEA